MSNVRVGWGSLVVPIAVVAILACSTGPTAPVLPDGSITLVDNVEAASLISDPVFVDSVTFDKVQGVRVFARYGGGCAEHAIGIVAEKGFGKSLPPVTRARVTHNARGDACDALITRVAPIDMTPLREFVRTGMGAGITAVDLDFGDGARLRYPLFVR